MKLSTVALDAAAQMGLSEATLLLMAQAAAPYTTPGWNRRYESYVLLIEDDLVRDVGLIDHSASDCSTHVFDCPTCDGDGCHGCKFTGEFIGTQAEYDKLCIEETL